MTGIGLSDSRRHAGPGASEDAAADESCLGMRSKSVHQVYMPIFLVTVFAKNEKGNLTPKEQAAAVELSKEIVSMWSGRQVCGAEDNEGV